ncbi:hypothetical protein PENANT_c013G05677 [Penicillium antarcticum]|uniref:Xylanolytic transcriptional activator regulatory domain-containing protein n=1 Tax=Penicillium antarcticum TaxID=416450 RepID=A0A1V6Q5E3_9EURO|nr:uncharacterized protein N7508_004225 [Penicillium antarcticum]KAJ5308846.1 hypothetical protein N7508_004225 [Penicillium antarcticum]OQD84207.1 hypothetical protein PENANT_c013G05677 [Penicillium antarcticum]
MASEFLPETPEIGSLTAHSREDSQFVGSSSGVYFIKTVKRAFNDLDGPDSSETNFPTAEDTLVGPEDSPREKRQRTASFRDASTAEVDSPTEWTYDPSLTETLGKLPPQDMAKSFMMMYFKVWHPLFPFLHGPTFLQAMEKIYSTNQSPPSHTPYADHRSTCWTTIFQCVFNLGSLLVPDLDLPPASKIQSPSSINSLLGTLSSRHDIASLQAILAIQFYLVATMSLRQASTVGGCVLRSMLHAGLHRCPFRYKQLSTHDRQLRKRIFWCGYAIDRYLSQALGLPLGIQDSDIDVCLPAAREMHSPGTQMNQASSEWASGLTSTENGRFEGDKRRASHFQLDNREEDHGKEAILASYVDSGTLTGRALELFHKSILVRSVRRSSVLFLVTDVHKWWNGLPLDLQRRPSPLEQTAGSRRHDNPFDFSPFFTVLYQHLILIIHRPSLSLDPSTAEFCSGLQTCIGAARSILSALRMQVNSQQALFWPGFLSAAWMSGLVLALACQLKQYVLTKGLQEIHEFSDFLCLMSDQWETAKYCHMSLSVLAAKIKDSEHRGISTVNSQVYVRGVSGGESMLLDSLNAREERRRKLGGESHSQEYHRAFTEPSNPEQWDRKAHLSTGNEWEHTQGKEHGFTAIQSGVTQPSEQNDQGIPADTPSSMQMNFQDTHPTNFEGISNFDLNMVDLIEGANLDSLFDMVGQQFPSF